MSTPIFPSVFVNYAWKFQKMILPACLGIPIAMEAISLGKYCSQNSGAIKEKIMSAKQLIVDSFTRQEGETAEQFKIRVIKNILIGLGCFLLVSAAIGATVMAPFLVLPSFLAIPVAILGACAVGDLLVNGRSYYQKGKQSLASAKVFLKDAFQAREGESKESANKRIRKNICVAALGTIVALAALGGACYGLSYLIIYMVHAATSGTIAAWNLYDILPMHSALAISLTYAAVGALHGGMAIKKWREGNKTGAAFHMACCLLSFLFPFTYWITATPSFPVRFHHSFLGLILQLTPFRSLQFYGSLVTFDAGMNALFFQQDGLGGQFDLQNIVVKNLSSFVTTLSALVGIQYVVDRILPKTKKEEITVSSSHNKT